MDKQPETVLAEIKKEFYAFRNGIVADALRKQGSPYKFIFGLNMPQLAEIAGRCGKSADTAMLLLNNSATRESQLLAAMVYPAEELTPELAMKWIDACAGQEAVDVMCLKLLRDKSLSDEVVLLGKNSANDLARYAALRLMLRNLPDAIDRVEAFARAESEKDCPATRLAAMQLINEIEFLKGD